MNIQNNINITIKGPLEIEPNQTATVPTQFLRPQRFFTSAQYAIGPHPYLIERFLKTDIRELEAGLIIKGDSSNNDTNPKYRKRLSKNYEAKSLKISSLDSTRAIFDVVIGNRKKMKPFDFIFAPGSEVSPAQFCPLDDLEIVSSEIHFKFELFFNRDNFGMTPWRTTFFLVSHKRKVYAPFEVSLEELVKATTNFQLRALFNSAGPENPPTVMLTWGEAGSGKSTICINFINLVHGFSNSNRELNFEQLNINPPNPVVIFPSSLVHLIDVSSKICKGVDSLSASFLNLESKNALADVCCITLNVKDAENSFYLSNALAWYRLAIATNKMAILVLTLIDACNHQLSFQSQNSEHLDKILLSLEHYGFSKIVPISLYREGVHTEQNDVVNQALTQILYLARFGKHSFTENDIFDDLTE